MRTSLLGLGVLLPVVSSGVYVASILRGKSRPHRMTRLLLVVICALSFGALAAAHDHAAIWLALVSLVQAVAIWALSLKRGLGGRDRLDFICLALCAVGLFLWLGSGQSLFGLSMSIVADFIACVPSIRKTIRLPHTESWLFFGIDTIAGACVALASSHTFTALLYPVYITLFNAAFVVVIVWPRRVRPSRDLLY